MTGKNPKTSHTSNSKMGMGDFYGVGVKNKTGREILNMIQVTPTSKKSMKKPPKSLA